jgi:hypothetical protein
VFHVELRRFPHNTHAFNLDEEELHARVLVPWLGGRKFEFGGKTWSPQEARLTIIEGAPLAPGEIAMGRGWSNAARRGSDVTERMLGEAAAAIAAAQPVPAAAQPMPQPVPAVGAAPAPVPAAALSALGRELLTACLQGPVALPCAWQLTDRALPAARASQRLALAEQAVRDLAAGGLIVLERGGQIVAAADVEQLLLARDTWVAPDGDAVLARITTHGARIVASEP